MQQAALDGFGLPVANHGARRRLALNFQRKDGVVAGLRVENPADPVRVHGDRDDRAAPAIDDAGNASRAPHAPRCVLAEFLARLRFNGECLTHSVLLLGVRAGPASFLPQMKSLLTEVSS